MQPFTAGLGGSVAAAASAAVASIISFKLSSNAASRLFMVLRLFGGFSRWVGEWERERREVVLRECVDDSRAFFAIRLEWSGVKGLTIGR